MTYQSHSDFPRVTDGILDDSLSPPRPGDVAGATRRRSVLPRGASRTSFIAMQRRPDGCGGRRRRADRMRSPGGDARSVLARLSRLRTALAASGPGPGRGRFPGHRPRPSGLRAVPDKPEGVEAYDLMSLAGDVIAVLGDVGVERAHVVGHDWGAACAWGDGIACPRRVDKSGRAIGRSPRHLPPHPQAAREVVVHAAVPVPGIAERWLSGDDWANFRTWAGHPMSTR